MAACPESGAFHCDRGARKHGDHRSMGLFTPACRDVRVDQSERIDHVSFRIAPWDTDGVRAALQKRGLHARIDAGTADESRAG